MKGSPVERFSTDFWNNFSSLQVESKLVSSATESSSLVAFGVPMEVPSSFDVLNQSFTYLENITPNIGFF